MSDSEALEIAHRRAAAEPIAAIALLFLAMSATTALLLGFTRAQLGGPSAGVFLSASLLFAAAALVWTTLSLRAEENATSRAPVVLGTLAVFLLACLPGDRNWLGLGVHAALILFCGIGTRAVLPGLRMLGGRQGLVTVMIGVAFGVAYFLVVNAGKYGHFLTPEFTLAGIQHRDTLFHAALASMVAKYGVVTTGLDGLVPIPYHFLSHALFGRLALWLGVSNVHSYYIVSQIVCIPLLFLTLSSACLAYAPAGRGNGPPVAFVLLPLALLSLVDVWTWTSYLVSESYFIALILFLLALPLLPEIATLSRRKLPLLVLATALLTGGLMFAAKVSVGFVWSCGLVFLVLRASRPTLLWAAIILAASGAAAAFLIGSVLSHDQAMFALLSPFHFLIAHPEGAWGNIVAISCLLAAIAFLWPRMAEDPQARFVLETFAVFGLTALGPAMALQIAGGSAYYFINIGTWAALVFIGGRIAIPLMARTLSPRLVVLALSAVLAATFLMSERKRQGFDLDTRLVAPLNEALAAEGGGAGEVPGLSDIPRLAGRAEQILMANVRRLIEDNGIAARRDTLVFVDPRFTAYWKAHRQCSAQPFLLPALTGVVMLKGFPAEALACDVTDYFGNPSYGPQSKAAILGDDELCAATLERDFARVFVVEGEDRGRMLVCDGSGSGAGDSGASR